MNANGLKIILLVEDEAIIAMATAAVVENFGFSLIIAGSGEEAFETASVNDKIDLILMDIDLGGGIDGPEAARRILQKRAVPIVFLTSHSEKEYVDRVKEITRYGYIIKNSGDFVLRSSIEMAFELFEAHKNTREREERLQRAEMISGIGSWELDMTKKFFIASEGSRMIYGLSEEELDLATVQKLPLSKYRPMLDAALKDHITHGAPYDVEFEIRRPTDGKLICIHSIAKYDAGRNILTGTIHDITLQKRAEKALRESEESLLITLQSIGDAVIATDTDGLVTRMNTTAERLTGWNFVDAKNKPLADVFKIINAETRNAVSDPVEKVLEKGEVIGLANHTVLISRNGCEYQIADSAAPIRDNQGNIRGVILVFSDVTEKYKAVEELAETKTMLEQTFEQSPIPMILVSMPDAMLRIVNPACCEFLGIADEPSSIGIPLLNYKHSFKDYDQHGNPGTVDQLPLARSLKGMVTKNEERMIVRKDGTIRWGLVSGTPIYNSGGEIIAGYLIINDITERRLAEDARNESNLKFMSLASNIPAFIAYVNADTLKYEFVNDAFERAFGIPREKIIGSHIKEIISEKNYQFALKYINEARAGKPSSYENSFDFASGKHWLSVNYTPVIDASGRVVSIVVLTYDITERKLAEEDGIRNESRLRRLIDILQRPSGSTQDFLDYALEQAILLTESKIGYIYHYNEERGEFALNTWSKEVMEECSVVGPSTCCGLDKAGIWGEAVRQRRPIIINDYQSGAPLKKGYPEGHVRLSKFMTIPVFRGSEIIGVIGLANKKNDYNETDALQISLLADAVWKVIGQLRAEDALRESEEKFRLLYTSMDQGLALHEIITDADGKPADYVFLDINDSYTRLLGVTREMSIGRRIREVMPEVEQYWIDIFGKVALTGESSYYENYLKTTGKYYSTYTYCPKKNHFAVLVTDITERKLAEEKIKMLLAEKELLLKEVHHRIKNNMNTVAGLMSLQLDTLKESSAVAALKDARSRVVSMMLLYDKLYRSDDFKEMSFKEYISPLVDEIVGNFPNKAIVNIEKNIADFMLDAKRVSSLGILINELLTNIMKYAFNGRDNGLITIYAAARDGRASVAVGDDGIGIPASVDMASSPGFGLQLVDMMTRQLRGVIKLERDGGTKFTLEFNL